MITIFYIYSLKQKRNCIKNENKNNILNSIYIKKKKKYIKKLF